MEQVLGFSASHLQNVLGHWSGVLVGPEVEEIARQLLAPEQLSYRDRAEAETDPTFKQLIPYVFIRKGGLVFRYQRTKKGGEQRLHNRWSIGVGGHINPCDGEVSDGMGLYDKAVWRELNEEVNFESDEVRRTISLPIRGLLYENSDAVGQVHFGIVHELVVGFDWKWELRDKALANGEFQPVYELKRSQDNFESWSRMVIDAIL